MQLGLQYGASSMLKEPEPELVLWRWVNNRVGTASFGLNASCRSGHRHSYSPSKGSKGSEGGSFRVFLGQTAPALFLALKRLLIVAAAVQPCGRVGSRCPRKGWASRWPEGRAASLLVR